MSPLDPARITRNVVENQEDGRLGADAHRAFVGEPDPQAVPALSGFDPSRSECVDWYDDLR
jgi:hypothetical protein